ncbi:MAG TPA: cytochrome P450 [Bryobacteraceae bacterium]|jgi:cytochrome P450|nr:cytochrome P450 [Bryobacteraceae bacterium]
MIAGPPFRKGLPILGVLPQFRKNPPEFLQSLARDYGDLVHYRLGPQDVYLVSNPDWIKDILVTHQTNFTKSRFLERAKVLLGEGLLTSEGEFHRRQRRLVQPAFHRDRLIGYASAMVEYTARTREEWSDGAQLDMSREMMRLTLSVVAKTLFSADVTTEADNIGAALTQVMILFDMVLMPFSEWIEKLPLPSIRRFERARDFLDKTIYGIIAERRASKEDKGDLLSMLLLAQDEDGGAGMSDKQIRDEALTLFLAGHETTANALMWSWYLLSQNPDAAAKFYEEVDRALDGRLPTFDDLPRLKFTEGVFAEAMRLYPPAWVIGRRAKTDYSIAGFSIPARSIFMMSPYVVHRDPRWFPEPNQFNPERWSQPDDRPKFSYLPFGGGTRVCIGERFAWMEGILLLAAVAQKWRFKLVPGHPVQTAALITLRAKHGMKMIAEHRSPAVTSRSSSTQSHPVPA